MRFSDDLKIILASGSPRRKNLLRQIELNFTVQVSSASEAYDPADDPADIVQTLALKKAQQVADDNKTTDSLVIGADTIVVHEDSILEKPATTLDAQKMLNQLSGDTHQVLTGVALVKNTGPGNKQNSLTFFEMTEVYFCELNEFEIHEYVQSGSPMDKAGGYGIQDHRGSLFVQKITGDYYNVVGFPLHSFYQNLKDFAPELISYSTNDSAS